MIQAARSIAAHKILLTGGAGFVGGYLAPLLASATPNAGRFNLSHNSAPLLAGWAHSNADITDARAIDALIDEVRPDLVVHLAAQSSVSASFGASDSTWRVNFDGTAALARYTPRSTFLFAPSARNLRFKLP